MSTPTTAARVYKSDSAHWYTPEGVAAYDQPKADGEGRTPTTLRHARKLNLLPSVTTILRVLDKPALNSWLVEQAVLACLTAPRLPNEPLDAFIRRVLQVEQQQEQESAKARDLGTAIHAAIECALNVQPIADDLTAYVLPAVEACKRDLGSVAFTEKIVVGRGYAGKADAGFHTGTLLTLVDFKTTKTIPKRPYDEHRLQLAAYASALAQVVRQPIRTANCYISTTEPGKFAVLINEPWPLDYDAFTHLVAYWQWANDYVPVQSSNLI